MKIQMVLLFVLASIVVGCEAPVPKANLSDAVKIDGEPTTWWDDSILVTKYFTNWPVPVEGLEMYDTDDLAPKTEAAKYTSACELFESTGAPMGQGEKVSDEVRSIWTKEEVLSRFGVPEHMVSNAEGSPGIIVIGCKEALPQWKVDEWCYKFKDKRKATVERYFILPDVYLRLTFKDNRLTWISGYQRPGAAKSRRTRKPEQE